MLLIKSPIITEKTTAMADNQNKYTFEVDLGTNKTEAAKELSQVFNVEVLGVRVINRLGKPFTHGRYRRQKSRKSAKKIMIFKLKAGDSIDLFKS